MQRPGSELKKKKEQLSLYGAQLGVHIRSGKLGELSVHVTKIQAENNTDTDTDTVQA